MKQNCKSGINPRSCGEIIRHESLRLFSITLEDILVVAFTWRKPKGSVISVIWESNKPKQRLWGRENKKLIYIGSMGLVTSGIVENLRIA